MNGLNSHQEIRRRVVERNLPVCTHPKKVAYAHVSFDVVLEILRPDDLIDIYRFIEYLDEISHALEGCH